MAAKQQATPETREFKAELKQLLDIIVHSLYSEKEIFLRELISNACDAIDRIRFRSLTDERLVEGDADWKIKLIPDKEARTLSVSDNGTGMSAETIVEDLGTIARSGTREFLEVLRNADAKQVPELIGQFGVGFYSAFMVADQVTVITRPAGRKKAFQWVSDGRGTYTVEPAKRDRRGTDVILHLREEETEFLEEHRLRGLVKRYSDFIEHPIVMDVERPVAGSGGTGGRTDGEAAETETVEEVLNSRKALWLRSPDEVSEDDYAEFYRRISHEGGKPLKTIHFAAEGTMEFRALLFLPEAKPIDFFWGEPKIGLQLYIQRVFIMEHCEDLLPAYLRFVRGVVDSSDLPLNVSREMLQKNPIVERIRKAVINKILRVLEEMKEKERDEYVKLYKEFGAVLKEGIGHDWDDRKRLADLFLFESTRTEAGVYTSLREYVDRMPPDQESIYYLIGETRRQIERSPYVEGIRARGREVLLLTDPVDEYVVSVLHDYADKPLRAVDRGEIEPEEDSAALKEAREKFGKLLAFLGEKIEEVKEVRLSGRLKESASCLVAEEGALGAHMERLLARMGRKDELPPRQRILELNAEHPAVQMMQRLFEADPEDPRVETYGRLLYDEAVIAEGSSIDDPAALARRINSLIEQSVAPPFSEGGS